MNYSEPISLIEKNLFMSKSELLLNFKTLDIADWKYVIKPPKWRVENNRLVGGSPDEPTDGDVFYKDPIPGDIVLEFDAEIIAPSYHDLVWLWRATLGPDMNAEEGGYLGCLGGWYDNFAGIEKYPTYDTCAIAPSFPVTPGVKYHIISGCVGKLHFIVVDGKLVSYMVDALPPIPDDQPGYFGFAIYQSMAAYWNIKVWRPYAEDRPHRYLPTSQYWK